MNRQRQFDNAMVHNIKPLGSRVLLRRVEAEEKTEGGIVIPDTAKEKPQFAEVISLGTGGRDEHGHEITFTVKEGDRVLVNKYGGTDIKMNGAEHVIMKEEDILAVSQN